MSIFERYLTLWVFLYFTIQVYFASGLAYWLNRRVGAALATVVGVLIEVPVMLSVVHLVKRSRGWYEKHRQYQ